jgi:hypothetical protein
MSWTARLLVGLALFLVGAAATVWGLAHSQWAARLVGVVPAAATLAPQPSQPQAALQPQVVSGAPSSLLESQIANLNSRLQRVESQSQQVQGSAGRADALLIAFAARRAIERGVPLGYLEPLLVNRFAGSHPQAVATIVTSSRTAVRLTDLVAEYQDLEPQLTAAPAKGGLLAKMKGGLESLVTIHKADRPSTQPQARYDRALSFLMSGEVDSALAETMRLPGAFRGQAWIGRARRYVIAHRALDEIETAALIGNSPQP